MKIGGFQKLSLLNYPEKTACTLFTCGCNFHCPWCHNSGLAEGKGSAIDPESVLEYLRKRRGMLEGVCISGGEPTLQKDLLSFLRQIKMMDYVIKLDTNGSHPDLLETAITEGLADYIAMDVKNTPAKYPRTIGLPDAPLEEIGRSAEILRRGPVSYEFRTTLISGYHSAEDIEEMARWLKGAGIWYLQPFRDAPEVPEKGLHAPSRQETEVFGSIANRYIMTMVRA